MCNIVDICINFHLISVKNSITINYKNKQKNKQFQIMFEIIHSLMLTTVKKTEWRQLSLLNQIGGPEMVKGKFQQLLLPLKHNRSANCLFQNSQFSTCKPHYNPNRNHKWKVLTSLKTLIFLTQHLITEMSENKQMWMPHFSQITYSN